MIIKINLIYLFPFLVLSVVLYYDILFLEEKRKTYLKYFEYDSNFICIKQGYFSFNFNFNTKFLFLRHYYFFFIFKSKSTCDHFKYDYLMSKKKTDSIEAMIFRIFFVFKKITGRSREAINIFFKSLVYNLKIIEHLIIGIYSSYILIGI